MPDDFRAKSADIDAINALPEAERAPTFNEPWEAQAFAIAVALQRNGVFTWDEWASTLGQAIRDAQAAGDPDTGDTYYRHWLAAVERIVEQKGIADKATLRRYSDAWGKAAERTPHGEPIELRPEDLT